MPLTPGDQAPNFVALRADNSEWRFDELAGRYVVLCFFGSATFPGNRQILDALVAGRERFNGTDLCCLVVTADPDDQRLNRVPADVPGILVYWDLNAMVSRHYGAAPAQGTLEPYHRHTIVLDPALRTLAVFPFEDDVGEHVARVLRFVESLPPVDGLTGHAPCLIVPRVFGPEFCRALMGVYERHGGRETGFMKDVGGRTVEHIDYAHKRRSDCELGAADQELVGTINGCLVRRLLPAIRQAFQFTVTNIERYLIACYDGATGGHFLAHRDDTTLATAHRRFAVTINLNAEEYEGGDLRFPEFGRNTYRAPTGGAVVFGCSLQHEVTPVTRGRRFAFLPFLYDAEAAKLREANMKILLGGAGAKGGGLTES